MPLKLSSQPEYDFIEYNLKFKRMSGFLVIGFFLFAAAVIILYLSVFRKFEWFQETWFISLLTHIKNEVFSGSSIGMFYACF